MSADVIWELRRPGSEAIPSLLQLIISQVLLAFLSHLIPLEHLSSALCPTTTITGWDILEVLTFGLDLGKPARACSQSSGHAHTHNSTHLSLVLV